MLHVSLGIKIQFVRLTNLKYMYFIRGLKVTYYYVWGWSTWPKHVAYFEKLIKFMVVDGCTYVIIDLM
jgi:hypothetical protein